MRQNSSSPQVVLGARDSDHDGLVALGIPVDPPRPWSDSDKRSSADPLPAADRRYAAPPVGWRR